MICLKGSHIKRPTIAGMRFCSLCEKFLPNSDFFTRGAYYSCCKCWTIHARESKERRYATRAYEFDAEFLRLKAFEIMRHKFNIPRTPLTVQQCRLLCAKYKLSTAVWNFLPLDPLVPLTVKNVAIVTLQSKRKLMDEWKINRDVEQYRRNVVLYQTEDNFKDFMTPRPIGMLCSSGICIIECLFMTQKCLINSAWKNYLQPRWILCRNRRQAQTIVSPRPNKRIIDLVWNGLLANEVFRVQHQTLPKHGVE
jgi:hypothetical protein